MSTCTPYVIPDPVDYGTTSSAPSETTIAVPSVNPLITYEIISTNACGDELRKETTLTYSSRVEHGYILAAGSISVSEPWLSSYTPSPSTLSYVFTFGTTSNICAQAVADYLLTVAPTTLTYTANPNYTSRKESAVLLGGLSALLYGNYEGELRLGGGWPYSLGDIVPLRTPSLGDAYYLDTHTTERHYQINPREVAQAAWERRSGLILEPQLDWCANVYGVNNGTTSFCTATGSAGEECYNTYGTCQAQSTFVKTVNLYDYCKRGQQIPVGETIRPYITQNDQATTTLPIGGGLAVRSNITYTLADETCSDVGLDPYWATRATPAQGTYWTRWLARNYNAVGRPALVNRGYFVEPFSWDTWRDELYTIESVKGMSSAGTLQITLSDVTKILDKTLWPVPTTGTLQAELKAYEHVGYVVSSDGEYVTLEQEASAIDDAYVGMECYISQGTAAGQRRVITEYVGATRTARLQTALTVVPDTTSVYEISALSINVGSGLGAQYINPASRGFNVTGFNNAGFNVLAGTPKYLYVAIGKEVIRCTRRASDVLSWSSSEYRAQFGTSREDHAVADVVQQCGVAIDKSVTSTIQMVCNDVGLVDGYIDLAGLAVEDANWLGNAAKITACFPSPTKTSQRLGELLKDTMLNGWWNPWEQKFKFKAEMPELAGTIKSITPDEVIGKSMNIVQQDDLRITRHYIAIQPLNVTNITDNWYDYRHTFEYIDEEAEGVNEYNGIVQTKATSQWLGTNNQTHARAMCSRRVGMLRNAPIKATFKLDPRDEVAMAQLIDVTSRQRTDAAGAPLTTRMRVIKLIPTDKDFSIEAVTTPWTGREAFIAPDGTADFPTDTIYAHISSAAGLMSDGSAGFTII